MIDLNPVPNRLTRPDTLDDDVDSFMGKLPQWASDLIALASSVGSSSSANRVPFQFSTSTAIADPGAGFLRLNSAAQNAATALALDVIGSDAVDYTALLNTFSASTSASIGQMRLEKSGDASKFLVFNVTAMTSPTGYRQFTAACIGYSSANPFANGDVLLMSYTRTGDKGNPGNTGYAKFADQKPSGTAGGSSVAGVQTRALNTIVANTFGATLASNQFTLPAGNYVVQVRAPALNLGAHRASLYNVTDSAYQEHGSGTFSGMGSGAQTDSVVLAYISISASKTFAVWHATQSATSTSGLGTVGAQQSGAAGPEVFTEVSVWKLS